MKPYLFLSAALLASAFSAPAWGEVMQGQHVVITGVGVGFPSTDINVFERADLDQDGITDGMKEHQRIGRRGLSGFVQYHYFILPSLGLGFEVNANQFETGRREILLGTLALSNGVLQDSSAGVAEISSLLTQYLMTVRYVIAPDRRFNPYLSAGIGLNTFNAQSRFTPNIVARVGGCCSNRLAYDNATLYDRTSLGLAAVLGGGIQGTLGKRLLVGIEGRWSYSSIDSGKFGTNSANFATGHLWLGWKWTAPL